MELDCRCARAELQLTSYTPLCMQVLTTASSSPQEHAGDLERDFSAEARILLTAVRRLPGKSWTHLACR